MDEIQDYLIAKKRFRITFEVEITVMNEPQAIIDMVEDGFEVPEEYSGWDRDDFLDFMYRQKHLFDALVQTWDTLNWFIRNTVEVEMAAYVDATFCHPSNDELKKILALAREKLSIEDQEWLQEKVEEDIFVENTEIALYDTFNAQVVSSSIEEIEGDKRV